jgi:hypothetical protein
LIQVKVTAADMRQRGGVETRNRSMDKSFDERAAKLRKRAEHYRRLGAGPLPWPVAQELATLADEDEDAAAKLLAERGAPLPSRSCRWRRRAFH